MQVETIKQKVMIFNWYKKLLKTDEKNPWLIWALESGNTVNALE